MLPRPLLAFLLCMPLLVQAEPLRLSLADAEARLARNRDVLAARRAAESAEAGVIVAGQAPNPTLSWGATAINTRTGTGSGRLFDKRVDQTIGVSQLIERGDKRELREASARASAQAAQLDLADARRLQRLAVHQAYYDLKASEEKLVLLREMNGFLDKSLEASERRLKAGDVAPVEVSRLRIEILRARNELRTAEADLGKARRALAWVIGEDARADDLTTEGAWPTATEPIPGPARHAMLERRPDVRAATARVDTAVQARELARRLSTRDVTVGASVERDRTGNPPAAGVTYGVSISVPLFLRYDYSGEVAQAETAYAAAMDGRERAIAAAANEAGRAYADYLAARDRLHRAETESRPEARAVAAASELAYAKGALGLIDLLDARRTLRALELDAVAAAADHAKARAAWLAATEWETDATP